MPTGYTHAITAETTLKDFVLKCATAFDYASRDAKELILNIDPDDYHYREIEKARSERTKYLNMGDAEARSEMLAEYERRKEGYKLSLAEAEAENAKYKRMRAMVLDWNPPEGNYANLKKFMLEQLDTSISDYVPEKPVLAPVTEDWRCMKIKSAQDNLEYHGKKWEEQKINTAKRNQWANGLVNSFK